MNILILTNEDPHFYPLLGPFLARRHVVKAYGGPLWDDDGQTWAVACTPEGNVMGFAALTPHQWGARLCNDYVVPEYRSADNVVQCRLIDALLQVYTPSVSVVVTASEAEEQLYREREFVIERRKGQYLEMKRSGGERHAAE